MVDLPPPLFSLDHPLAGCEAKLRRAQEHLELLDNAIGAYLDGHSEVISRVGAFDPETNIVRWKVLPVKEPDIRLAAIIGEFVHDLRSTLDHLAFELSFLDTGGVIPPRTIAFPCCLTRDIEVKNAPPPWNSKTVQKRKLAGINAAHRAMIYRAQPCYRRNDTASSAAIARRPRRALADLKDLWNHDKHRSLQPIASAPFHIHGDETSIIPYDCWPIGPLRLEPAVLGSPLKEGTTAFWMMVKPMGPEPKVEWRSQSAWS